MMRDNSKTGARYSIVVLSYNRPALLRESLISIMDQIDVNSEIIVIDNNSPQQSEIAGIVSEFSQVRFVANSQNRGYTGGMNQGLSLATGDYILLTEDDIAFAPHSIRKLLAYLHTHPEVGLVSAVMRNHRSRDVRCAGGLLRFGPPLEMQILTEDWLDRHQHEAGYPVDYLPGAMLCARREFWKALGGFQVSYFMYYEDVDLCIRAARNGFGIHVVSGATIYHFEPDPGFTPDTINRRKLSNLLRLYIYNGSLTQIASAFLRYVFLRVFYQPTHFRDHIQLLKSIGELFSEASSWRHCRRSAYSQDDSKRKRIFRSERSSS